MEKIVKEKENEEVCVISFTKSQCKNLADFIEFNLLSAIREDEDIDNILWVSDMCESYRKLRDAEVGCSNGEM